MAEKKYEVVVGIDFGSSGTGFAYSYYDKKQIIYGEIHGASTHYKVKTEIILDDKNNLLEFGSDCAKYLRKKGLEQGHYFKDIKMELYANKDKIIAKNSGKALPLKLVIQKVLETIRDIAIKEISGNKPYLKQQTEKFKWVVTVPAIWNEHQKSIMMESCIGAGLVNKDTDRSLFFALEPEAASLYCLINKEIDRNHFKKGEYYIVCDLGGGTGDIVAHLVGSNNELNEIAPCCGGNFGSDEIDKKIFEDIIQKLFGCKDFNSFYAKYRKRNNNEDDDDNDKSELFDEWSELEREIKDFKESITNNKIENKETHQIFFSLFKHIFNEDVDINDLIEKYNKNISDKNKQLIAKKSKSKWKVELPYEIIYDYLKAQAKSIAETINSINSKEKIKSIIFVGGYCSNEILLELIIKDLKKVTPDIKSLKPSYPCLAIMEGAVIFGIEPSSISIRKAKYTIGLESEETWDDKRHSPKGNKIFNKYEKSWFCEKCFSKYIEINQSLKYEEELFNEFWTMDNNPRITFYKTKKTDPIFVSEEGIIKIGECFLKIDTKYKNYEDRRVRVILKFGGTYIDVTAIHLKSGDSVKTTLTFS